MDIGGVKNKILTWCRMYKYSILVLLIGLLLMALPGRSSGKQETAASITAENHSENLEKRLSTILSQVTGAGKVEVVLSASAGEEVIYQTNIDKALKIKIDPELGLKVSCNITIFYGCNVVETANAAQAAVCASLEAATNTKVAEINVNVCGVVRK